MRDVKFRAWDKEDKCMVEVDSIHFPLGKPSGKDITVYNRESDCYEWIYNYELMQFIGIKDEYTKDIYEGDIVERIDRTPIASMYGKIVIGIVGFDNGSFVLNTDEGAYSMNNKKFSNMCSYRVIGNIYENPELLG